MTSPLLRAAAGEVDLRSIRRALDAEPQTRALAHAALTPLPLNGVAHAHVRVEGHGLVLRLPRALPWAPPAAGNLAYQAACFARAAPSGATPALHAVLTPSPDLPRGGLVVAWIAGRPPRIPDDLPAIAACLARLHALPLPPPTARPPLYDHGVAGPFAETLAVVERHWPYLAAIDMPEATRRALAEERRWAEAFAARLAPAAQRVALVATDAHPGNYVIRADGAAILVDLEKGLYGSPEIDLAHATLPTSATWSPDIARAPTPAETEAFYRGYAAGLEPALVLPARRLTWLRTMLWFARWRAVAGSSALPADSHLALHIRAHIARCFDAETVAACRSEWV